MTTTRCWLLAGATALTAFPATAMAQPAEDNAVEEVVVTARKVDENLQDVPISMSAVSGEAIEPGRAGTVEALNNIAPNVKIFKTAGNSSAFAVYIRGVGRNNGNFNVEAPVALYVDDVIYPYQVGPVVDIGGIARVEVLRGPQGTLYGRNATVGAVKYVTVRPNLFEDRYSYALTGGSFGRAEAQVSASNVMIADRLAMKVDLGVRQHDGFLTDVNTGEHFNGTTSFSGRASLLWVPSETTEVYVALDGTVARDPLAINVPVVLNPATGKFVPRYGDYYKTAHGAPEINDLDVLGLTVQGKWEVGPVALRSITAYRGFDQIYANDPDARADVAYTGSVIDTTDETFTQEFQVTGALFDDRLTFVGGLFYLSSLAKSSAEQTAVTGRPNNYTRQRTESRALYVDATFAILSNLHVSAGVRYTDDEKSVYQSRKTTTAGRLFVVEGEAGWTSTTPRVGIDWDVTEDILLYATWGKGFKAGQLNSIQPTTVPTAAVFVPPEQTENTEIGIKTEWLDGRLRINANYFWTEYTDQTQAIIGPTFTSILVYSDAEIEGLEVEVHARPTQNWTVTASLGTLKSQYVNVDPSHPVFVLADKTLQHAPELTWRLATDYTFENVFGGELQIGGELEYVSLTFQCLNHAPVCIQDEYEIAGAFATYSFPGDRYQLILAGTNVTGTEYFKLGSTRNTRGVGAPAEWSLTFKARW